jgi:hypothetical protein
VDYAVESRKESRKDHKKERKYQDNGACGCIPDEQRRRNDLRGGKHQPDDSEV